MRKLGFQVVFSGFVLANYCAFCMFMRVAKNHLFIDIVA